MAGFAPGAHFETANVRNLLAAHGVEASEAMCLGVGGGIAAGYQFCPSVPNYGADLGSGVQMIPRVKLMTTNGAWYVDTFARLGVGTDMREATGKKAAAGNLEAGLATGKPVVAWTTPLGLAMTHNWTATCGMYTVLVHGVAGERVSYSDHISVRTVGLEEFTAARARVCSLKNRTMTVKVKGKLDWKGAALAGLAETAQDFAKPRLGTFNLPGLKEGVGLVNGRKNKKAWPVVFPGEKVLGPMRDVFESIEGGTGGGLMRPLYAELLDEAAKLTGKKGLGKVAGTYRKLGAAWTEFAEFLLPFPELRAALRRPGSSLPVVRLGWDERETALFLDEVSRRMGGLYEAELAAAAELTGAVG